jgi:hypothetical protein
MCGASDGRGDGVAVRRKLCELNLFADISENRISYPRSAFSTQPMGGDLGIAVETELKEGSLWV